ncbi:hypothetical protein [Bifidobacterium sp. ESL0790]|uniref:hypothetical protein n=1 Tax=Bifidobacterium sp. ESL0790 TaxID=2983233 RepID=UPI0023F91661|nr:hypothetical protein [Bifidobacterium sp. ESL0790]WEV71718.1 hypothetical protein OZY47_04435 [Bifidobacterium sp. ESL0790]
MKYYKNWREAEAIEPLLREYGWHASSSEDNLLNLETWHDAQLPSSLKKPSCTVTILDDGSFKVQMLNESYRRMAGRRMTSLVRSLPALQVDLALRLTSFYGPGEDASDWVRDECLKNLRWKSDLQGLLDYWDGRPGELPDVQGMVDPRWFSVGRWETGKICLVDTGSDELYRLAYVANEGMKRRFSQGEFLDEDLCSCLPYAEATRRMFEAARNLQWVWSVVDGLDVEVDDAVREVVTWWSQVDELTARPFEQKDRSPKRLFTKTSKPSTPPHQANVRIESEADQNVERILNPQLYRYGWHTQWKGSGVIDLNPTHYHGHALSVRAREDGSFEIHSKDEDHGHIDRQIAVVHSLPALQLRIELLMAYDEDGTGRAVTDAIRKERRKQYVTGRWLHELLYDWEGLPWNIPDTYGLVGSCWFSAGKWVTGAVCLVETTQRAPNGFRLYRLGYVPDDATRDRYLTNGFQKDDECKDLTYIDGVRAMLNLASDLQRVWSIVDDLGIELNDEARALVTAHVRRELH